MRPALNRAMFAQRGWDSGALTVLASLVHVFEEAGGYELFVLRDATVVYRATLVVGPDDAPRQLDFDLPLLAGEGNGEGCCGCEGRAGSHAVSMPGLVSFHVSRGAGAYSVKIQRRAERHKEWVLDSAEAIPEGDLFAVAPVRPGTYAVTDQVSGTEARIDVRLPRAVPYRMDEPTLVEVTKGFEPAELRLLAGRAVVFLCQQRARITVTLLEEHDAGDA